MNDVNLIGRLKDLLGIGQKDRLVVDDQGRPSSAGDVARDHRRGDVDKRAEWQQGKRPLGM